MLAKSTYPFHTITLALPIGSKNFLTEAGPQSSPIQSAGIPDSMVADPVFVKQTNHRLKVKNLKRKKFKK